SGVHPAMSRLPLHSTPATTPLARRNPRPAGGAYTYRRGEFISILVLLGRKPYPGARSGTGSRPAQGIFSRRPSGVKTMFALRARLRGVVAARAAPGARTDVRLDDLAAVHIEIGERAPIAVVPMAAKLHLASLHLGLQVALRLRAAGLV